MPRLSTLSLSILLLVSSTRAEEAFTLVEPPAIFANALATLTLSADESISLIGDLPGDARVRLLAQRSLRPDRTSPKHRLEIDILPFRPGTIEMAPLPIRVGKSRLIFRCPPLEAQENPAPEDLSRLVLFWNGEPKPPERLWQGQQVGLDILQISPTAHGRPSFLDPILELHGGAFEMHIAPGAQQTTPLTPIGAGLSYASPRLTTYSTSKFKGENVAVNRSKAFFTVGPDASEVTLQIASTATTRKDLRRTARLREVVPALPLPALTDETGPSTGLIGEWKITGELDPAEPVPGEPFSVIIHFEGRGDPAQFIEPDFSSAKFRSVHTEVRETDDSKIDYHRGIFTQHLLPLDESAAFQPQKLASFDTLTGSWISHTVAEGFGDFSEVTAETVDALRPAVIRPLPMNFPKALIAGVAIAPLLPLLGLFARRVRQHLTAPRRILKKRLQALAAELAKESSSDTSVLDEQMLPLLREYQELPPGASATELADALQPNHPELAERIRQHANASFRSQGKAAMPRDFAALLGRLACFLLAVLTLAPQPLRARERPALAETEQLVAEQPEQPAYQLRLARELIEDGQPHRARAVCHHLLLLDPFYPEARKLMTEIRERIGDPATPGSRFLELRPDQIAVIAAAAWILGFLLITVRLFHRRLPRWPVITAFSIALLAVGAAFLRYHSAYIPGRYMVAAPEVVLEVEPGRFASELAPLRSGEILEPLPAEPGTSHLEVQLGDQTYFVPVDALHPVW